MKAAQIMDVKSTVQEQFNTIGLLKTQIEAVKAEKLNLQREIQQLQLAWEETKSNLRVSGGCTGQSYSSLYTVFYRLFSRVADRLSR